MKGQAYRHELILVFFECPLIIKGRREEIFMSANRLEELLKKVRSSADFIVGSNLVEVILYGSYARGDFDEESDVDIALIVKNNRESMKAYRRDIVRLMSNLSLEYDALVSISCIPEADFEEYRDVLPYYRNIDNEGVRISA